MELSEICTTDQLISTENSNEPCDSTSTSHQQHSTNRALNTETRTVHGKTVHIHTWDGPDDPENPYVYLWIL